MAENNSWDHTVDVLVIGSGGGGMLTSIRAHDLGADALVIEKTDKFGGTTAMSGGVVWIPNNDQMAAVNIPDSEEDGFKYLNNLIKGAVPEERIMAYVKNGKEMVKYVNEKTHLTFTALDAYPDYYTEIQGYKSGARSMDPGEFDGKLLGEEFYNLRPQHPQTLIFGRLTMTTMEFKAVFQQTKGWVWLFLKTAIKYMLDIQQRIREKRSRRLTLGNSVAGALRRSMMDRNIPLWRNTAFKEFVLEDGAVVGVVVQKDGKPFRIRAKKGVVCAAGGFEKNQAMRDKYLPKPTDARWSAASPGNTGDVIQAGQSIGADTGFMDDAWWGPTVMAPGEEAARMMIVEKSLPGQLFVNKAGKRFCDEAAPYIEVVHAMYAANKEGAESVPAYMVYGAEYRKKYPVGPILPGSNQPDATVPKDLWDNFVFKANTPEELASKIGVDPANLANSIKKMNEYAVTGIDPEFAKGGNEYDRFYGDEKCTPNPCLARLDPPFYAVKVFAGELGTKGGLLADAKARVIDNSGNIIKGLYAIGNCSSALMGPCYAGAGSTIGPAMTFGYIAANEIVNPQSAGATEKSAAKAEA